ncbi:MAG: hypothetical protein WC107_01170 [Patescibacteria group bacterium]
MLRFVLSLFPLKAKSLAELAEILKSQGCKKELLISPNLTAKNRSETGAVGMIATFQYILDYTALTTKGRKVKFRECLFERFGSARGFSDSEERRNAAIKHFLHGEKRVEELQEALPGIQIVLEGPGGLMDRASYDRLHQDAEKYRVSI